MNSVADQCCFKNNSKPSALCLQFGASLPTCFTEIHFLVSPDLKKYMAGVFPFVSVQLLRETQKVIVFFSSCELVEFHYILFLQTLLSDSGALAPELCQPPPCR